MLGGRKLLANSSLNTFSKHLLQIQPLLETLFDVSQLFTETFAIRILHAAESKGYITVSSPKTVQWHFYNFNKHFWSYQCEDTTIIPSFLFSQKQGVWNQLLAVGFMQSCVYMHAKVSFVQEGFSTWASLPQAEACSKLAEYLQRSRENGLAYITP